MKDNSNDTPPPQSQLVGIKPGSLVERAMVEAMVKSLRDPFPNSLSRSGGIDCWRDIMRSALRAALAPIEPEQACCHFCDTPLDPENTEYWVNDESPCCDSCAWNYSISPKTGEEPNGADRSPKPKRQFPVLDVEEIASMLYEAANPTMRWSYLYPSHNHLHAAVRQRFLDAAARFQGALASTEE